MSTAPISLRPSRFCLRSLGADSSAIETRVARGLPRQRRRDLRVRHEPLFALGRRNSISVRSVLRRGSMRVASVTRFELAPLLPNVDGARNESSRQGALHMHDIDRTQLEAQTFVPATLATPGETVAEEVTTLESPFAEAQELELASELLGITNEQELEYFLGNLINTVGGAVGRFAASDTGRALGGILKGAAKQALPVVGR